MNGNQGIRLDPDAWQAQPPPPEALTLKSLGPTCPSPTAASRTDASL